jgi:hypothetical protein
LISLGAWDLLRKQARNLKASPIKDFRGTKGGFAQSFPQAQWKGAKAFCNQRLTSPFSIRLVGSDVSAEVLLAPLAVDRVLVVVDAPRHADLGACIDLCE